MASSDAEQPNPPFEPITPQNRPFTKRTGSGIVDSEDASPKKRPKTTVESAEDTESDLDERIHGYEATKAKLKRQDGRGRKKKTSSFSRMGDMADDLPELFTFSDARSPSPVPTATRKEKVAMETDPTQTKRPLHNGEPDQHFEQGSKRPRLASPGYSDIDEKVRRAARLRRENTSYRQRTYQRPIRSKQRESDFWQDVNFEQFRGQSFAVDPDAAQDSAHPSEPPTQEVKQEEEPPLASSRNPIIIEDDSDDDDVQRTPFDRRDPNWRPNAPNKHQTDESSQFENDPYSTHTRGSGRVNFEWFENIPRNYRANGRASTSTNLNRWTPALALERYNRLSESFDNFKGTPENPVPPLDQVPWPVLFQPPFQLEQVDWASVEKFFENAETLMSGRGVGKKQWKEFLKTSTRRFHPDRWRARGLIGGKGWGSDVEEKVNHVSKVLTPLYRALG
ncbi:hypothetical protein FRC17_011037 [Serendipita sp. 399]|nr:hypothetical protein FRC17_011037 [Serendipita sp. 399]